MDNHNEQTTPDNDHEGRLAAENAKRRIQAKEATQRADAAEAEAASLRRQIAELRLSQARQQVTAAHPELTAELIEKFAPADVDADGLEAWADKALELVIALRGEKPVDPNMTPEQVALVEKEAEQARSKALAEHPSLTEEALELLCDKQTPDGIARWSADFERIFSTFDEARMVRRWQAGKAPYDAPTSGLARAAAGIASQHVRISEPRPTGLRNVAHKLTGR